MGIEIAIYVTLILGFFGGLTVSTMLFQRDDPHNPKPDDWEERMREAWFDGFRAGEKSMAKRMTERLKKEEILMAMQEGDGHDG